MNKFHLGSSPKKGAKLQTADKSTYTQRTQTIEFNLELPQDIFELVRRVNSKKFIILENFHYLNEELQRKLSFDLRTFQELGMRFIILGVWREKNRLTQFNGDLLDRIEEVPVEPWEQSDFEKVISKGSNALNIKFSNSIITKIIDNAFDSIGVMQELLKLTCKSADTLKEGQLLREINDEKHVENAIAEKVEYYASRHERSLESIAEGRRANKPKGNHIPLYLPYYLVRAFLGFEFNEIVKGVRREFIESKIKSFHHRPNDVRPTDISNLLHKFAELQSEKKIVPPIFDYDRSTKTMRVIDSTFYFFLRNTDRNRIIETLINPLEARDTQTCNE